MMEIGFDELAQNVNNPSFGDDRLGVLFYMRVVEDPVATKQEGRKIFTEKEYVKIMVPGDRHNVQDRPVQKTGKLPTDHTLRFPQQYARFKSQQEQRVVEGTPIHLWPQIDAALAEEFKFQNVFTVEQLAELADTHVAKFRSGQALKAKAKVFVQALKDQAEVNKLQAQLSERDNRIAALENELKELGNMVREMKNKGK